MLTLLHINKVWVLRLFYSNYIALCNRIGKAPSAVAEENGFKRSVVTRWSKGAVPRQANIQKLADYFDVPVSELVGEQKESPGPEAEGVSEAKKALFELVDGLSDEQCAKLAGIIEEAKKLL